jgi:hypothetical protein
MGPIHRGEGVTASERYLARLAEATFLDLWSYPNTFIDKRGSTAGDGKEFSDLLVVFGDDVIIFSDKSITWPEGPDIHLNWARWYRRAVKKSVDQIRGAARWLRDYPDRVFVDPACTQRLPIELPAPERRRIHGVAIALGAQAACSAHVGDADGSLMIAPSIRGDAHTDPNAKGYMPFALGDVDPNGPFVHVFDETGLDLVMGELDTASDFVRYLKQCENFIREQRLLWSSSEAELLGSYLRTGDEDGRHKFPETKDFGTDTDQVILLAAGGFAEFSKSKEYRAKKAANAVSYSWDRLIGVFTEHVLAGTSVAAGGGEPSASRAEYALRAMAREDRTSRRALGTAFIKALQNAKRVKQARFARVILPNAGLADQECGYVFLVLAYPKHVELKDGYDQYRKVRLNMLEVYCAAILYDHRNLKRMVGVAVDAPSSQAGEVGGSEDLMLYQIEDWTPDLERSVEQSRAHFDVMQADRIKMSRLQVQEYPAPKPEDNGMNRQQRRAAQRQTRKVGRRVER